MRQNISHPIYLSGRFPAVLRVQLVQELRLADEDLDQLLAVAAGASARLQHVVRLHARVHLNRNSDQNHSQGKYVNRLCLKY